MTHRMSTIASLPQEVIDQELRSPWLSATNIDQARCSKTSACASRILFRRFYINLGYADPTCPNERDDIKALLELSRSGASRFIRFLRVSGSSYRQSSEPTKEAELAGTIVKCLRGYMRPDLKALDFYNIGDSMLHEFSRPAMAPTIAGLRFLKAVRCPGRSNSTEIRRIFQYCEGVQAVEWSNCPTSFEGPTGIIHPESLAGRYGCSSIWKVLQPHTNEVIPRISPREMKCYGRYPDYWRLLQHDLVRLRTCSLNELYEYK
ncbi:hypothetical protein F9C07_2213470 [Aspergillus flavus]|uniref:Uncharacterized protein n=1 Tax=Aspergillus flavus (strain ATCC 200026 / FGSC A1120 / IAM 13836 / NRRL 3357 / JCM 12722 / SRRC 167) TaxID=332952 RepID=A0A7U2QZZ9_ASPFN|nr:hypothetical protein F9C07_2213470 [Aspergillus flavus]